MYECGDVHVGHIGDTIGTRINDSLHHIWCTNHKIDHDRTQQSPVLNSASSLARKSGTWTGPQRKGLTLSCTLTPLLRGWNVCEQIMDVTNPFLKSKRAAGILQEDGSLAIWSSTVSFHYLCSHEFSILLSTADLPHFSLFSNLPLVEVLQWSFWNSYLLFAQDKA